MPRSSPGWLPAVLLVPLLLPLCCRAAGSTPPGSEILPQLTGDVDGSSLAYLPPLPAWTGPAADEDERAECLRLAELGLWDGLAHDARVLCRDFAHAWSCGHVIDLGLALGVAGAFANTDVDQHFRDWYQRDVRSGLTDSLAQAGKVFGDHWIVVPVCAGALAAGHQWDETCWGPAARDWGGRCLRAYCVGGPTVLALQYGLGASRPDDPRGYGSSWQPFRDNNGVAGHGFAGAVPFLAAASVCDNRWLKGALFLGSFWTGWSRINDDSHYLSQVILGWTIAAVSMDGVLQTDRERMMLSPLTLPDGGRGVGFLLKF